MRGRQTTTATVSGSFNRFLPEIRRAISELAGHKIAVLSPQWPQPRSSKHGFIRLKKDKGSPKKIEQGHLNAIRKSDFLYVVNPEGYIGRSVSFEIGYAIANGVPVFCTEPPSDIVLGRFVVSGKKPSEIKEFLPGHFPYVHEVTLGELQTLVKRAVTQKGFEGETLEDKVLLLTEEVGELARAARGLSGVKISKRHQKGKASLARELADILIYVADIANVATLDLEKAFVKKMLANTRRDWRQAAISP